MELESYNNLVQQKSKSLHPTAQCTAYFCLDLPTLFTTSHCHLCIFFISFRFDFTIITFRFIKFFSSNSYTLWTIKSNLNSSFSWWKMTTCHSANSCWCFLFNPVLFCPYTEPFYHCSKLFIYIFLTGSSEVPAQPDIRQWG